ncbi:MAG TPA: hypothetical protein VFD69_08060 [Vicinamibacterales bacterium]|nr:hypothetical protein [Vicinamibacterales bacterium]
MPYLPSRRLEAIAAALLPPSSREHVLGDLTECAHTPGQYLASFVAVLPKVVFSELRRKLRADSGLALVAALTAAALGIAAVATRGRALAVPGEWLRWTAPGVVWLIGCALAAAYGRAGTRLWNGWCVLGAFVASIGAAALAGAHLAAATTAVAVAAAAHIAITLPRAANELARLAPARAPLSLDNLDERARDFQRKIWWRNFRESAAGLVVLTANFGNITNATSAVERAGPLLTTAGILCVMLVLHTRAGSRRVPGTSDARSLLRFHQDEILRQRDMLRLVPLWYLLPLAPGMVVGVVAKGRPVSGAVALTIAAIIFYGVARLNQWGARWLDRELADAQAIATGTPDRSAGS